MRDERQTLLIKPGSIKLNLSKVNVQYTLLHSIFFVYSSGENDSLSFGDRQFRSGCISISSFGA